MRGLIISLIALLVIGFALGFAAGLRCYRDEPVVIPTPKPAVVVIELERRAE